MKTKELHTITNNFPLQSLFNPQGLALHLLLYFACAFLIITVGEVIFRSWNGTREWLIDQPFAIATSAAYLTLWLFALGKIFSSRTSICFIALSFIIYSCANDEKVSKLGMPIVPSDLLLSSQYVQVVRILWGGVPLFVAAIIALIWIFAAWHKRSKLPASTASSTSTKKWLPLAQGVCVATLAIALIVLPDYNYKNARFRSSSIASALDSLNINNINWSAEINTRTNGQLLSFLMNAKSALIQPPINYSQELISKGFDQFDSKTAPAQSTEKKTAPVVIVIMSEALWDPAALPGLTYSDQLLSKLNDISRGTLFSPVFGGYTANTEFEFLTRLSNAYLPNGSIPYWQYINHSLRTSLAADFAKAGYRTVAIHPFDGKFWNRDKVYSHLGFQKFISESEFKNRERTPPYISDASMAKEIISTIQDTSAQPHFIFAVSMQNHGPYNDGDTRYPNGKRVKILDSENRLSAESTHLLETYATGVRDAIRSFELIVNYLRVSQREAIVVMFGDHLPFLGDNFSVYLESKYIHTSAQEAWTSAERERMHTVPVIAWSNHRNTTNFPNHPISPIFLGSIIKDAVGLPTNNLDNLLTALSKEAPIISQFYSKDRNGLVANGIPTTSELASFYRAVQYDQLFGNDYLSKLHEH